MLPLALCLLHGGEVGHLLGGVPIENGAKLVQFRALEVLELLGFLGLPVGDGSLQFQNFSLGQLV